MERAQVFIIVLFCVLTFLDTSDAFANGTMLGIADKMDNLKNYIFESFEDDCAIKGMVIGVVVGSLATLMIIAMVYVLNRYCCKCKKRGNSSDEKLNAPSGNGDGQTSEPYVIVDIYGFDPVSDDVPHKKEWVTVEVDNPAFSPAEPDVVTEDVSEPEVTVEPRDNHYRGRTSHHVRIEDKS